MWDDIGDRIEGFDAALGRSWSVDHERFANRAADSPTQPAQRVHQAHSFGQPRGFAVDGKSAEDWLPALFELSADAEGAEGTDR